MFIKEDVESIMSIPLSFILPADRLTCSGTLHGAFTIKSAYWIAFESKTQSLGNAQGALIVGQKKIQIFYPFVPLYTLSITTWYCWE